MCLPSNGKREHFSETTVDSRLLVSRADKLRGTRKPRVQPVSPLVASRIGHPSSKLGPRLLLDTATRCGEEGKQETSLREEATSHRGLFTREFNLCALLYSTSRCVASSHETRRKRPSLFPLFLFAGTYTLLSRKVFSLALVSYLRRRSSRGWRGSNFFFPTTLLYRHPFGFRSVSSTVEVGVLLHLFNPEKENIESIFFKQGIKHERERE